LPSLVGKERGKQQLQQRVRFQGISAMLTQYTVIFSLFITKGLSPNKTPKKHRCGVLSASSLAESPPFNTGSL
jgi:hypothetical protein